MSRERHQGISIKIRTIESNWSFRMIRYSSLQKPRLSFEVGRCTEPRNTLMLRKWLPAKLLGAEIRKITGSQLHRFFVCVSVGAEAGSHKINTQACSQSYHSRVHQMIRLLTLLLGVGVGLMYQNMFIRFPTSNRTLLTHAFPILKFVTADSFCKSSNFTLVSSST